VHVDRETGQAHYLKEPPEEIATVEGKKALMLSNMSKYLYNIMQGRRAVK